MINTKKVKSSTSLKCQKKTSTIIEEPTSKIKIPKGIKTESQIAQYLKERYQVQLEKMTVIGLIGEKKKATAYLLYRALNQLGMFSGYIGDTEFYLERKRKESSLPSPLVSVYEMILKAYNKGYSYIVIEIEEEKLLSCYRFLSFDYLILSDGEIKNQEEGRKLFRALKKKGTALINNDHPANEDIVLKRNRNITFGISSNPKNYTFSFHKEHIEYRSGTRQKSLSLPSFARKNPIPFIVIVTFFKNLRIQDKWLEKILPYLALPSDKNKIPLSPLIATETTRTNMSFSKIDMWKKEENHWKDIPSSHRYPTISHSLGSLDTKLKIS